MSIVTFGSEEGTPTVCEIVRVGVNLKGAEGKELVLFAVPRICEPLPGRPITMCVDKFDHLSHLDLADSTSSKGQMEIDILIGSDYYWDLATGETVRG